MQRATDVNAQKHETRRTELVISALIKRIVGLFGTIICYSLTICWFIGRLSPFKQVLYFATLQPLCGGGLHIEANEDISEVLPGGGFLRGSTLDVISVTVPMERLVALVLQKQTASTTKTPPSGCKGPRDRMLCITCRHPLRLR